MLSPLGLSSRKPHFCKWWEHVTINKKTDLKKALTFMKKATWEDMFFSEKYESIEWSELDEAVGNKRLDIVNGYLKSL